jgi:hypothetical protein
VRAVIFRFFQKAATQRGVVLEITPVGGVKFFFEKSSEKPERFQKFWKYTRWADF